MHHDVCYSAEEYLFIRYLAGLAFDAEYVRVEDET